MEEQVQELVAAYRAGRLERREFLRWAAILGLAVPFLDRPTVRAATPIRRGGTLRVAISSPKTIEPPLLTDSPGVNLVQPVGEYLLRVGTDLIPRPELASSWTPGL